MMLRHVARSLRSSPTIRVTGSALPRFRHIHTSFPARGTATLPNILAGGPAPPVVVKTLTPQGLQLDDGLIIPGPCLFLEGGWRAKHLYEILTSSQVKYCYGMLP